MLFLPRFLTAPTLIALSLTLIVFGLPACSDDFDLTQEEHIARAKDYQDKGEYRSAEIELKNVLQKAPENVEARWLLGQIYLEVDSASPAAEKELRRAIELGLAPEAAAIPLTRALLRQAKYQQVIDSPFNLEHMPDSSQAELSALQGDAYFGLGKLDKAKELYDKSLSIYANTPEAETGKARVAAAKNNFGEARERLAGVIEKNPDFAPAWSLLGNIEKYENKAKEAEIAYSEAITHRHNNVTDLLNRALVRIYLKDYNGAVGDMEKPKEIIPGNPFLLYVEGQLQLAQERYAEAQTTFQKALNKDANYMPAVYYLGVSHYMQGHTEQAKQQLRRFLEKYPGSDSAAKLLAAIYQVQGDHAAAESLLKPILARNPNDVAALKLMATTAVTHGKGSEGTQYLRRVVAQQPESANAFMQLGINLLAQEEDQEALQSFEKAGELAPSTQEPELLSILALLKAGEYDKAIDAAKRLSEKQPDNPHPITLMGGAYLAKGDETSARAAFEQALSVAPGDPAATDNLANLELRAGNVQEARRLYEDTLKHLPAHLPTLLALVQLDKGEGKVEQAMQRLEYAVQENSEALQPRVQLAGFYLRTDEPNRVLTLMQVIPEDQAKNPFVLGVVGEAQLALGQSQNAVKSFERLVQVLPNSARAHYLLAQGYAATGRQDQSLDELEKVLAIKPDHQESKIMKIRLLRLSNQQDEAAKLLSGLDPTYSDRPEVLIETGWLAMHQGDPGKAVSAFERVLKQEARSDLIVALGIAKWQTGDKKGSIETYTEWLEQHPTDTQVLYHLANSRLLLGQSEEAKIAFEKLVKQSPNHVITLNNLAWLLRDSQPDKALSYAERAVELAPDWAVATDTLGVLLLDRGESEQALRLFEKASKQAPDNLDMRYHIALALVHQGDKTQAHSILEAILADQMPFEKRQEALSLLQSLQN